MNRKAAYEALLREVCVSHGWCGGIVDGKPSYVNDFIPHDGPVTAEQFVAWIFIADGVDPSSEPDKWQVHKDGLRAAFVRHMGTEIVDASELKGDGV